MNLRSVRHLHGCSIHALDGNLGHVDQFYFDDLTWTVRYLVAHTGNWLLGRKVLISVAALGETNWEERQLGVNLTRRQIEDSPPIETHRPVSRRWETELHRYYNWPAYWDSTLMVPDISLEALPLSEIPEEPVPEEDTHLQSTHDLIGYRLEAAGDAAPGPCEIGRVADFLLDPAAWTIRYLDIDTRDRHSHRHILLPPIAIAGLDWENARADTPLRADLLRNAPPYDPAHPLTPAAESQLRDYYR